MKKTVKRLLVGLLAGVAVQLSACSSDDGGTVSLPTGGSTDTSASGGGGTTTGNTLPGDTSGGVTTGTPVDTTPADTTPVNTGNSGGGTGSMTIGVGGYVTMGDWGGYAWTGKEGGTLNPGPATTITPADFSDYVGTETQLCASGTVGADEKWGGVALLGINVGQAQATDTNSPEVGTANTSGYTGIYVDVSNTGGSTLRLQIQTPAGETDENQRWCAEITGTGGVQIPFSEFKTACWNNSGSGYSGAPISAVIVVVPGSNTTTTPFDFCINNIYPY